MEEKEAAKRGREMRGLSAHSPLRSSVSWAIPSPTEIHPEANGQSRKYNPRDRQRSTKKSERTRRRTRRKGGDRINQQRISMAGGGGRKRTEQEVSVVRQLSCDVVMYVKKYSTRSRHNGYSQNINTEGGRQNAQQNRGEKAG